MQTNASSLWSPPTINTGESRTVERSLGRKWERVEWTAEERRWWAELMEQSPDRNRHFETEGRAGINR